MTLIGSSSGASFSPSTHSPPRKHYHVFLSFKGEDTRTGFTDHLYASLGRKGIATFRDKEGLDKGEVISDELIKAIEGSMSAIIVFSKNYASSSWCSDELQKFVESRENMGQIVFPVFYGVDPSDIRHQKGNIGRAFEEPEEKFREDKEKVQKWREALTFVANLTGWDTKNRYEADIIEEIATTVRNQLCVELPSNFDHLVGLQSKIFVDIYMSLLLGHSRACFGVNQDSTIRHGVVHFSNPLLRFLFD